MSNPDWRYGPEGEPRWEDLGWSQGGPMGGLGRGYGETFGAPWGGGVGAGPGYTGFAQGGYGQGELGQAGYGPRFGPGQEFAPGPALIYSSYVVTTTYSGRGPRGYRRSDARIEEDVNEELTRHPDLDASDIEVKVENGEVTLTGTVEDRQAKRLAEDVAERCSGVADVHNRLRVKRGLGQRISDMLTGGEEEESGERQGQRSGARTRARGGSTRSR